MVNENKEAANMAIPPNNGILLLCILRSFGSSNRESLLAILIMEGMDAKAIRNDVRKQRKKFSIAVNIGK